MAFCGCFFPAVLPATSDIEVGPFRDNQPETGAFCRASLCPETVVARHFGTQSDSGFLTTTTFVRLPSGAIEFVGVELASSHSQPGTLMPLRAATARRPASKGGDRVHRSFKFAFCVATPLLMMHSLSLMAPAAKVGRVCRPMWRVQTGSRRCLNRMLSGATRVQLFGPCSKSTCRDAFCPPF